MQGLASVLKPLAHATTMLSAEKNPSISVIKPILTALLEKHMYSSDDDSAGVADLESTIATSLHGHFTDPEMKKLTLMSSAIDPQFKSLRSTEVYANLKTAAIALQQRSLLQIKGKGNTEDILEYRESNGSSRSDAPDDTVDREVKQYKFEPQIERDEDPLERWKTHQAHLKCLSCLAKRFLCMQGTSVPSERLFSTAGFLVETCLHPASVDMLLFLNKNL